MKPEYWLERWRDNRIGGFNQQQANARLVQHHRALGDAVRVLVPLCGKSVDLEWLAVHGFDVVGIELSEMAARGFFEERGFSPARRELGPFIEFSHGNVAILVGDFFAASTDLLGYFDGAYDRAAMIALPPDLRARYVEKLRSLLRPQAKLLLVTLFFDAEGGPPFSVSNENVRAAYAGASVTELSGHDVREESPNIIERGATFVQENAYAIELPAGT